MARTREGRLLNEKKSKTRRAAQEKGHGVGKLDQKKKKLRTRASSFGGTGGRKRRARSHRRGAFVAERKIEATKNISKVF